MKTGSVADDPPAESQEGQLRQLEYQSVFELSLAITRNRPEEGLFNLLENNLLEKLGIAHFSLFNLEDGVLTNSFCYGKMVSGWKTIPKPDSDTATVRLADFLPELQQVNPHLHWLIPFHFDGHPSGLILCQQPALYAGKAEPKAIAILQTLAGLMLMARENQKLLSYRLRQESLKKEMEIARQVQKMLFPRNLPESDRLHAYATYLPHLEVSGDYFDYIPLEGNDFAFCVADVSGKGMPAALLMSNFQACLRTLMMDFSDLAEVVIRLNRLICSNSQGERFITAFIGLYRASASTLQYVNCGHLPPILVSGSGEIQKLESGSTILGIFPRLPSLHVGEKAVSENTLLALFTDGLVEIENAQGEEFGEERLNRYFLENRHEKMAVMHQRLLNRLDDFAGKKGFEDDLTLLTLRFGN